MVPLTVAHMILLSFHRVLAAVFLLRAGATCSMHNQFQICIAAQTEWHTSGPMPAPSSWLRTSAVDTSKVSGRGPLPLVASVLIASRCASVALSARVASRGACAHDRQAIVSCLSHTHPARAWSSSRGRRGAPQQRLQPSLPSIVTEVVVSSQDSFSCHGTRPCSSCSHVTRPQKAWKLADDKRPDIRRSCTPVGRCPPR